MKRMLINATQEEELRMAMVDGQRLYDLNIELPAGERKKANIYKGKITRVEPSLEAAFVDYGADRHGFLPLKEISSEYFVKQAEPGKKPNIREVLREGQDIVVQIDKEERGNKGAALTTFVSLAGRFIVLKPNKAQSGGVSRRIVGSDRDLARKSLNDVVIPDGMSVILRTAGIDRSAEELAWDLENLLTIWHAILNIVLERPSPFLIYRESDSVVRALRDYLTTDIGEILIDDESTYKDAKEFVEQVMPHNQRKLKHYNDPVPLFTRYQIETQIESAFTHNVDLPSGGSIVIDHTEALVSIDINSARATKGGDIEATALNTNLEAADEIARQLRIRDLGGLIVIDFIDMGPAKNQREVENRLREAVRQDRARVQIGKISRFGLLEMSRQRLRPSLGESAYLTCPRCSGIGTIRSVESLALAILRIIGEEARKERTAKVIAQLPVEVATFLLNEKRDWVQSLESRNEMQVVLVANSRLETPHYEIRRVRDDQTDLAENAGASYLLTGEEAEPELPQAILERKGAEIPAVATMKPTKPVPKRAEPEPEPKKGLIASLMGLFSADDETKADTKSDSRRRPARKTASKDSRKRGGQRGRRSESGRKNERQSSDRKRSKKSASKKKASNDRNRQAKKTDPNEQKAKTQQPNQKQSDAANEGQRPPRKRRSRGGRRRKRSDDRPAQDANQAQSAQQPANNQGDDKPQQRPDAAKSNGQGQPQISEASPPKNDSERKPRSPRKKAEPTSDKPSKAPAADAKSRSPESKPAKPAKAPDAAKTAKPAAAEKASQPPKSAVAESKPAEKPASEPAPKAKPASSRASKPQRETAGSSDDAGKPARKTQAQRSEAPAKSDGPPRARTDAERQADARAKEQTAKAADATSPNLPVMKPKVETARGVSKPAEKPADKPQETAPKPAGEQKKPEGRLLPWEPASGDTAPRKPEPPAAD